MTSHGRIDTDQLRVDWTNPDLSLRAMGKAYGVSGEAVRQAAKRLGLGDRVASKAVGAVDLFNAEVAAIWHLSQAHDDDEDTPLTGGEWVRGPDRILRWKEHA